MQVWTVWISKDSTIQYFWNNVILTHCLTNIGIWGVALQWLTSFLHGQGQRVALATVTNLLYIGLPLRLSQKFQLIQNAAACVLTRTPHREHIQPDLCKLYWLLVEYRIRFKILVLNFKSLNSLGAMYLRDHLSPRRVLGTGIKNLLAVPRPQPEWHKPAHQPSPLWPPPGGILCQIIYICALWDILPFRRACKVQMFHHMVEGSNSYLQYGTLLVILHPPPSFLPMRPGIQFWYDFTVCCHLIDKFLMMFLSCSTN